ncbi:DUF2314 domain-containing protein [Parerythrobacter lacustris]|uniref:DUF2314 domain-containing protein n=1 Tax=Parerythrobacter lacustris TaxID=2969984 RepID=A0ABT1XLQ0_9SPHN|nr:DUF2314 domain-containing protein [Parerythrobacter lacustris]MCR2832585.1 DUF2314 domain-containing protein [Parerythrobacter lacustris]
MTKKLLSPRILTLALAAFAVASPVAAQEQGAGEQFAVVTEAGDPETLAARAKAQATLPEWLGVLAAQSPDHGGIQFQFALGGREYIWVENVAREGDRLTGTLVMAPVAAEGAKGDRVEVPLAEVTDWAYWTRDERGQGVAHGFHTYEPLFADMPPERANELRRQLGWAER